MLCTVGLVQSPERKELNRIQQLLMLLIYASLYFATRCDPPNGLVRRNNVLQRAFTSPPTRSAFLTSVTSFFFRSERSVFAHMRYSACLDENKL